MLHSSQPPGLARQLGFTMIEILIVMIIIGALGAIGLVSFTPSLEKARDARRKADLANIAKTLEAYNNDHGRYPASSTNGRIICRPPATECTWGSQFVDEKSTVYMAQLPADPRANEYFYATDATGSWYALLTRLENETDPTWPSTGGERGVYVWLPSNLTTNMCGGSGCGFVVTAPGSQPADFTISPDEQQQFGGGSGGGFE